MKTSCLRLKLVELNFLVSFNTDDQSKTDVANAINVITYKSKSSRWTFSINFIDCRLLLLCLLLVAWGRCPKRGFLPQRLVVQWWILCVDQWNLNILTNCHGFPWGLCWTHHPHIFSNPLWALVVQVQVLCSQNIRLYMLATTGEHGETHSGAM